jgi:hypothetical protein
MQVRPTARLGVGTWLGLGVLLLAGCASMPRPHWPFGHKSAPAPEVADEIAFEAADGSAAPAWPQFWKRNALVVDMQGAGASGVVVLHPKSAAGWPVRLALRIIPGAFAQLEVRGAQRVLLPINASAAAPLDIELPPSSYARGTPSLRLSWGAAGAPAPDAPD